MEKNEQFELLGQSIELVKQEAIMCPEKTTEAVRRMREGIGVYLDGRYDVSNDVIALGMNLQFRSKNVSLEVLRHVVVQEPSSASGWNTVRQRVLTSPVEGTPAMENVWMENVSILLSRIKLI